ncbi:MAG: pyruvate dehydrogenase complex dihydrolipoamide acetyltransferase [Rickettsiaceae bacterium]|nr:pyruvate dehydrogenase complex dihydrolipoamide acetyltransferase [Rickettsiaceae bacterium]MDP4832400.1 pyruvate dehydrogenase complex dihydrolipoamide acetyltransferase [Rickettsiaceae bacterium]MDP5020129.1 pyruvate dehydrogenase complex dihydrolipoamide acetyltransferase [Rickettsiaceae bacterium]MDP5082773.1 pyruvate dehydrogenase complex dihydrolipoamide acetyltransferase [Rickettsiaceae bacterium]
MPIKILMPALSPTMEHGNLAKWIKKEGDKVSAGEVIAEIETDKATMEVEAVEEGVLAKIIVAEGAQEVPVNALIAVLLEEGEAAGSLDAFIQKSAEPAVADKAKPEPKIESVTADKPISMPVNNASNKKARIFASPLAKRVAAMEGVSLSSLTGTGPHGRIIKADVLSGGGQIKAKGVVARNSEEYKSVPNNNMRKIIAKRLLESKLTVPHFYLSIECMMDSVLEARAELNASFGEDKSKKLSVNDFVIMAAAKALKDVPDANASWSDEAIMLYNNVDISIAVAIDGGLITPVIRNADQKAITAISAEMKDLAKRARENALKPEEFQGGGFSISNLGMYGVKNFNAIINPPQGCIIAVGMSSKRAVIVDDKIEIRTMMDVNLSCDHRVVDGAVGATFLASFKKYIESPILMFI